MNTQDEMGRGVGEGCGMGWMGWDEEQRRTEQERERAGTCGGQEILT